MICGAHEEYITSGLRYVWRTGGALGLGGGAGKRMNEVSLDDLRAFGISAD